MKNFTYYRPSTTAEAVGLLEKQWGPVELLAGGTDLLDLQKEYVAQPDKVVSLGGIHELAAIQVEPGQIVIGADAASLPAIAEHPELKQRFPALTTAAGDVGGPQIRNMGTLGGNLCQRNRCWYFRDEHTPCLLKGGEKCFALEGENRYHAIFTQGCPCVIVNPSTLAPGLIALGAIATVLGPNGEHTIALVNFFQAPSRSVDREHVLAANEVVTSVRIPPAAVKNASYEVRHKQSYDWPLVQAAVALKLDAGKASGVKIVLGHVAPTPRVAETAAQLLEGKEISLKKPRWRRARKPPKAPILSSRTGTKPASWKSPSNAPS